MMQRGPLAGLRFMRDHRFTQRHLSEYLDEELSPRGRHRIEHHSGICPHCRRMLETLRETLRRLGSLRRERDPGIADSVIERLRAES
jgi:predicted anti-sigma-YlaC factor YlaD